MAEVLILLKRDTVFWERETNEYIALVLRFLLWKIFF